MNFLPIVERELRQLSRRPMTYRARSATALAATLISLGVITVSVSSGSSPASLGRNLCAALALLAFGFNLLAGPVLTADCLSEEKRAGTLGLLFLTSLKGYHVTAGKLVAMAMPAAHCLLAIFPILAISFFMGGVTGGEFVRVALVLVNTLFFSLSAGLLVSVLSYEGRKALGGTVLLILAITFGLPALGIAWSGGKLSTTSPLMLPSPAYAFQLTPESDFIGARGFFWGSLIVNQLVSWGFLIAASVCLPHVWQDRPIKPASESLSRKWLPQKLSQSAVAHRRHLLDANPILWLAGRNRSPLTIWLFLLATIGLWCGGYVGLKGNWIAAPGVLLTIYFLHAVLKVWVAWEATHRIAEDRNSGVLELLLCTPVREERLWRGWLTSLKERFLAPVAALVLMDFFAMASVMSSGGLWGGSVGVMVAFLAGIGLFLMDAYTLSWVGVWQGLTARNSTRACLNTIFYILILPGAGFLGVAGIVGMLPGTGGPPFGLLVINWFVLGYLVDLGACGWAMIKLSDEFRAAAIYAATSGPHLLSWRASKRSGPV